MHVILICNVSLNESINLGRKKALTIRVIYDQATNTECRHL